MSVHPIRLAGPWDYQWLTSSPPGPEMTTGTVKIPCSWRDLFGSVAGKAAFSRRFHRPTNLEPHEKVVVVLTGVGGAGSLFLNKQPVSEFTSTQSPVEADVTALLERFNVLEVVVEFDPARGASLQGGLFAPVILEIRSP